MQKGSERQIVQLVRGKDEYGNFEIVAPPGDAVSAAEVRKEADAEMLKPVSISDVIAIARREKILEEVSGPFSSSRLNPHLFGIAYIRPERVVPFKNIGFFTAFSSLGLAHQSQVGIAAEVGEIRKDFADLAVRKSHPSAQRSAVLLDGSGWDQPACSHIIGLVGAHDRVLTVDILPGDPSPGHDVVAAPTVIGAIAVGGERAAKVRNGEERHLAAQSGGDHQLIEVLERSTQLAEQGGDGAWPGYRGCQNRPTEQRRPGG